MSGRTLRYRGRIFAWVAVIWPLLCAGCEANDTQHAELREKFVLSEEPAGATTIKAAKEAVAEKPSITLIGQVGLGDQGVFVPGKASFLVTEVPADDHAKNANHDASNCPFCKRKAAKAPRASGHFVAEAGKTIAIDSRPLCNLKPGDTVIIRGQGKRIAELDQFHVTADAIYVRPRAPAK